MSKAAVETNRAAVARYDMDDRQDFADAEPGHQFDKYAIGENVIAGNAMSASRAAEASG